jgi:hypothetical protein
VASFIQQRERDNESYFREWVEESGVEGAKVIRDAVEAQVEDYNYLKQFALVARSHVSCSVNNLDGSLI